MAFNPIEIVQEVRQEFDELLDFVIMDTETSTADQVERHIFRQLLRLGLLLLKAFFQMRSHNCNRESIVEASGLEIPYLAERERTYYSVFGKLKLVRPYFYSRGTGGRAPLDEALGLGEASYSELLREMHEQLSVYIPYEKAVAVMSRFFNIKLSKRVVQNMVSQDASVVTTYYEQKEPPLPTQEAPILVIQGDGKGVPLVKQTEAGGKVRLGKGEKRSRKKEAVVTSVYTIAARPRTAEQVLNSFFKSDKQPNSAPASKRPQNKQVWATLQGKDVALDRLQQQVKKRDGDHIKHRVALCDGDEALQTRIVTRFGHFQLILDFIHANEYLWKVTNSLFGETGSGREAWVKQSCSLLLSSQTQTLIDALRQQAERHDLTAKQVETLTKTANYFERNSPYMDYATYLEKGWPIASGVIEGACRHLVKDRMELSGMRWQLATAEALLSLRAVAENGDWQAYHTFRQLRKQQRLQVTSASPLQTGQYVELPCAI
jgi:hypothetical protein